MGWTFLDEADDDSLTAAEWEHIFLLVNRGGIPHAEIDVDPLHCPTCRIAHAAVMVARETRFEEALGAVSAMPALALVDAFIYDGS